MTELICVGTVAGLAIVIASALQMQQREIMRGQRLTEQIDAIQSMEMFREVKGRKQGPS